MEYAVQAAPKEPMKTPLGNLRPLDLSAELGAYAFVSIEVTDGAGRRAATASARPAIEPAPAIGFGSQFYRASPVNLRDAVRSAVDPPYVADHHAKGGIGIRYGQRIDWGEIGRYRFRAVHRQGTGRRCTRAGAVPAGESTTVQRFGCQHDYGSRLDTTRAACPAVDASHIAAHHAY